jgi:hypothetical protein
LRIHIKEEENRAFFKRFMGFFKDQEKILAAAHHYHPSFTGHFNCANLRFGNCAFYLHVILDKSFCRCFTVQGAVFSKSAPWPPEASK